MYMHCTCIYMYMYTSCTFSTVHTCSIKHKSRNAESLDDLTGTTPARKLLTAREQIPKLRFNTQLCVGQSELHVIVVTLKQQMKLVGMS